MYVELTSPRQLAIHGITFEEAQIITHALIELNGKLKNNEHFVRETNIAKELYNKIDREMLMAPVMVDCSE